MPVTLLKKEHEHLRTNAWHTQSAQWMVGSQRPPPQHSQMIMFYRDGDDTSKAAAAITTITYICAVIVFFICVKYFTQIFLTISLSMLWGRHCCYIHFITEEAETWWYRLNIPNQKIWNLKCSKTWSLLRIKGAISEKFHNWPHLMGPYQNESALKILHKIPPRLCVQSIYET